MIATTIPLVQQEPHHFPRGARPSPRHVLCGAPSFRPMFTPPAQVAYVPPKLAYWGNNQYGDCVSAEEAFAKACYGLDGQGGGKNAEIFLDDSTVISWARQNGYLNGADLGSVLQSMSKSGFQVGNQLYNDGPFHTVDYSNEGTLQAALAQGPVKIAIGAGALPSGAGSKQGWFARGGGDRNTDHSVSLAGYGPAGWLYEQLAVSLPSALTATTPGYLLFTWSTIGFVDHAWIMGTCAEAWIRNPTTVGVPPLAPPTPPTPPVPTLTLPDTLDVGQYAVGTQGAPVAMLYVPNKIGAGGYTVNVPSPPSPVN
jgi:hypothetical protein